MPRRNFTPAIIKARRDHAGLQCEGILADGTRCTAPLDPGRYHGDHNIPDQLGGEPTFENCRCLCIPCHKAKTAIDVQMIAKAKRNESAHLGLRKAIAPDRPMQGQPMPTTRKAAARVAKAGDRLPQHAQHNERRMPRGFVSAGDPR